MRAVTLSADRPVLEVTDVADPVAGPGEALIRVVGCGICGSDLHIASAIGPEGRVLGHEIAGVVEELGPDPHGRWTVGQVVTGRPFFSCRACDQCLRGRPDHCLAFELVGLQRDGGFAERTVLDTRELVALPAGVGADDQPLVEPLAVASRGLVRGAAVPGDRLVVLGGGPIGLATVAWARALGIEEILVSEPTAERRALAERLGASVTVDPLTDDLGLVVLDTWGGRSATLVAETSGRPGLVRTAMDVADIDGRVVVLGICLADDTYFPFTGISKELDVRFAIYYEMSDFTRTVDALEDGRLTTDGFVTDAIGLDELPERFAHLLDHADGGKVVVRP